MRRDVPRGHLDARTPPPSAIIASLLLALPPSPLQVLRLSLQAEVKASEAKARRSKTTGSLVVTMPKVDPSEARHYRYHRP